MADSKIERPVWATHLTDDHDLDPLEALMVQRFEEAFTALWPTRDPYPPRLLRVAFDAATELVDFVLRTDRGRAAMRKRLTRRWNAPGATVEGECYHPKDNDLTSDRQAQEIIVGLRAVLQGIEADPELDGIAEDINAWLAGGAQ